MFIFVELVMYIYLYKEYIAISYVTPRKQNITEIYYIIYTIVDIYNIIYKYNHNYVPQCANNQNVTPTPSLLCLPQPISLYIIYYVSIFDSHFCEFYKFLNYSRYLLKCHGKAIT